MNEPKSLKLNSTTRYSIDAVTRIFEDIQKHAKIVTGKNRIAYYNIPCSFDIETTSAVNADGDKVAFMYIWTFNINGVEIYGREWEEFIEMCNILSDVFGLHEKQRLRIYVHNLAFEFQFMRKYFEWLKVFAVEERKVVETVTEQGIEFRCSYLLSGYSLQKLPEQLQGSELKKLVGDLDYKLIRSSNTPITDKEMQYCINDTKIVTQYIKEKIQHGENIPDIPLTKTGYVRRYCKQVCFYDGERNYKEKQKRKKEYRAIIDKMTLTPEEYDELKQAFQGGFTHASAPRAFVLAENIGSYDETSAYPACEVTESFPMSAGQRVTPSAVAEFDSFINNYNCLFDLYIEDLEPQLYFENPLSASKCRMEGHSIINNGRVVYADKLVTTVTEIDYKILCAFYRWKRCEIFNMYIYKSGRLPTRLIKVLGELYRKKTELKGVEGKEVEYLNSKEQINANYGMMVTDIVRDDIIYNSEDIEPWTNQHPDKLKAINKYNKSKARFLFYPWGVWITAYARKNLFTAIAELKDDYFYSDTDSVKGANMEQHRKFFETYNNNMLDKLQRASYAHGIPVETFMPKTIKGVQKPLGVWDFEGVYKYFKTLGAKRYMTYKDGKLSITVSGLNKSVTVPYLLQKVGLSAGTLNDENVKRVFDIFTDELYIPKGKTGKNILTYIDEERTATLTDYIGQQFTVTAKTGVHLSEGDYSLSISQTYKDYLTGLIFNKGD